MKSNYRVGDVVHPRGGGGSLGCSPINGVVVDHTHDGLAVVLYPNGAELAYHDAELYGTTEREPMIPTRGGRPTVGQQVVTPSGRLSVVLEEMGDRLKVATPSGYEVRDARLYRLVNRERNQATRS